MQERYILSVSSYTVNLGIHTLSRIMASCFLETLKTHNILFIYTGKNCCIRALQTLHEQYTYSRQSLAKPIDPKYL